MKVETRVGLLVVASVVLVIGFAYLIGGLNPFANEYQLNIQYNYAGGIEVGSPVRVMGIKVGKVKSIEFDPEMKSADGKEVKLRVKITVDKRAWTTVRKDSQFFINLAGIIGEKFLEISPGSNSAELFTDGDTIRGEDPPRIDQLISQGYGLAGKILQIVDKNEGSFTSVLGVLDNLMKNMNQTLIQMEKTTKNVEVARILRNIDKITDDLSKVTGRLRGPDAEKTYDLIHRLIWRLDDLDAKAIRKFLQEEGVRARIF